MSNNKYIYHLIVTNICILNYFLILKLMFNQLPKASFPSSFSIDLKSKYKQRFDLNMTVLEPASQNFLNPISGYDTLAKENSSPSKKFNISTDKIQENGLSIKNRFEQIKKKYDSQSKQIKQEPIAFQRNPLLQNNMINYSSELSARNPQRKATGNNSKLLDFSYIEKINPQQGRYQKSTDYKTQRDILQTRYAINQKIPSQEKYASSSKQKSALNNTFSKQNLYKYKFFNQPSANIKSSQRLEKDDIPQNLNQTIDYFAPQKLEQQQKMQSIDKINQKIDKIMRCIKNDIHSQKKADNNNPQPRPYYDPPKRYEVPIINSSSNPQNKYPESIPNNNYSMKKNQTNQKSNNSVEIKQYSAKRYSINNIKNSEENNNKTKLTYNYSQEKDRIDYKNENPNKYRNNNVPQVKVSEFTRSPSLIQKTSIIDALKQPKDQYVQPIKNNNNNLDDQIKKIHQKIRKSEEQKKKLNLKFEIFMKPKEINKQQSPSKYKLEKISQQLSETSIPSITATNSTKYEYMFKDDEQQLPKRAEKYNKLYSFEREENTSSCKSSNNIKSNNNPERISKFNPQNDHHYLKPSENKNIDFSRQVENESIVIQCMANEKESNKPIIPNLKLSKSIEQRESSPIARITHPKQKEQNNQFSGRNYQQDHIIRSQIFQQKQTIDAFKKQITFDQKFRDSKLAFANNKNSEKWKKLKSELQNNQINMNDNDMKNQFEITPEELDPFYSSRQSGDTIENLVKRYKQNTNHWNYNIKNKFTADTLEKQGFNQENIDLQRKGYIIIEDLVRFMNLQTGTFYRNRDFILCFRRITKNSKITYKELVKVISC